MEIKCEPRGGAEFAEDIEGTDTDRGSGKLSKEKEHESHLCLSVFMEDNGLEYVSS